MIDRSWTAHWLSFSRNEETIMQRVTGIGGVFMKARNPEALREWYRDHLGLNLESWGGAIFQSKPPEAGDPGDVTVWAVFPATSEHFAPSTSPFMINYRVSNLAALLEALRLEGCAVDDRTDESEQGRFGWVMDPEGNRVELWEPTSSASS
jgi:catechol 2,3-dioxygenase-like lactoylglutathione lyase family enzyme